MLKLGETSHKHYLYQPNDVGMNSKHEISVFKGLLRNFSNENTTPHENHRNDSYTNR